MADVTAQEDVALPVEKVWDVIGDFVGIQKWATIVQEAVLDESGDMPMRVLTMSNGNVAREPLVVSSQFSYTYTVADRPLEAEYRGTVAAIPLDKATTRIVLVVHALPTGDQTDEEATERYERFVQGNLKAMKRALGVG